LQVQAGDALVGHVDDADGLKVVGCLESGYRMTGVITSLNAGASTAVLVVRGEPPE
jgi:hypothetical protein